MLVKDIVKQEAEFLFGAEETDISFLTIDSRKCQKGALYFAITGTQVDGHSFIKSAYENGASAAVVEHKVDCPIPQIIVKNTRSAMAKAASEFFGNPAQKLKLIGVTGTNGKTSISYIVKALARANNISCGVIGTSGMYVDDKKLDIKILTSTTPDPIELHYALSKMVELKAKWVVMEVTAHALDLCKIDGMLFECAGFTNLTQDHLDYFGTMEKYASAKEKFFLPEYSKCGIMNLDDDFGKSLYDKKQISFYTYSIKDTADFKAENIKLYPTKSTFDLLFKGERYGVETKTTGLFNISNVLCAIGIGVSLGLTVTDCIKGVESFFSVPGRFESVNTNGRDITVIVDYAHTPDGLRNVLSAINSYKKGKLICVFGCGGNRDATKRSIMGQTAGKLSDYCVLTSDNPRFEEPESIIDSIEEGIKQTDCAYIRNADRAEAIRLALEYAACGDIIAICGKGDEDYQEINGEKHHFSDRETVEKLTAL